MNPKHVGSKVAVVSVTAVATAAAVLFLTPALHSQKQQSNEGIAPPLPSIGTDIPATCFGPTPSQVKRELIGPYHLLKAGQIDLQNETITLPLYQGRMQDGRKVWYILTDTTDKGNAEALGLNYSAKLNFAAVGRGCRVATLEKNTMLTFHSGTVDFRPNRRLVPGDGPAFPPKAFEPGSIGDKNYSPLVRIENAGNHIYDAPIIAFNVEAGQIEFPDGKPDYSLVHDKVVKISPKAQTVTLQLTEGFSFAQARALPEHRRQQPVGRHAGRRHPGARPGGHHSRPRRQRLQRYRTHLRLRQRSHRQG